MGKKMISVVELQLLAACLILLMVLCAKHMDPVGFVRCRNAYQQLFWEEAASMPEPARFAGADIHT